MGAGQPSGQDGVAKALFGRTRREVLGILYGRPGESFYMREIIRLTGAGTGAVQRELAQLTAAGLVKREKRGRQVYFRANPDSPVYPELRGLLVKTTGMADRLRVLLSPLSGKGMIRVAFIYGSVAAGEQGPGSDIDLMIIGRLSLTALLPGLRELQEVLGREINPSVYDAAEFRAKVGKDSHFLRRVLSGPKLMLVGTPGDLEELAG